MSNSVAKTVAFLAGRRVAEKFGVESGSPMVRVTCLRPDEVVALVEVLRPWKIEAANGQVVVAVTATREWPDLRPEDLVPREGVNPTNLRNQKGVGVVLIEGDTYTDEQSWQKVLPISDGSLLPTEEAREELVAHLLGRTPPELLTCALEAVFDATSSQRDGGGDDRDWIRLVEAVCRSLASEEVVDEAAAWAAIGAALPEARLFFDDSLQEHPPTDLRRRLRRNCLDSHRILYGAEDNWRDGLQDRARDVLFHDASGSLEADQLGIRERIVALLGSGGAAQLRETAFRHWLQVVDSKVERKGLGTAIREHIAEAHPDRVGDYDALNVADDIDAGSAEAAQVLLDDTSDDDGKQPLAGLATQRQGTALERMANPRAPLTETPLAEILSVVAEMVGERAAIADEDDGVSTGTLELGIRRETEETEHSRGIFAWLFGPTLSAVAKQLEGGPLTFEVGPELREVAALKGFELDKEPDEDTDDEGRFGRLELKMSWSDGTGNEHRVDWNPCDTPGLVALWRLACRPDVVRWHPSSTIDFDAWIESSMRRSPMVGGAVAPEEAPEIAQRWWGQRAEVLRALAESGLSAATLEDYADLFGQVLTELRNEYVPMGTGRPEVAAVVETDLFIAEEWAAVLATHPLRLRWVAAYLSRLSKYLLKAFEGELSTNPVNPDLFFDHLMDVSPQAQPPVAVVGEKLFVSVREQDWHEQLAPLKDAKGERRDWLADLDDGAIDDVADTIARYLDAYPHKADGLHILYIVRRHGARGLHRLVKNVLGRIWSPGATLVLTLFVEVDEVREVEEMLQEFDDPDHRAESNRPPVQATLHRWEDPQSDLPEVGGLDALVDVAVVPNLFGASTRTQESTRDGSLDTGAFDPLFDEPTRLEAVGSGDRPSPAVSRVLLPVGADSLLETWSTLTTRQFRGTPVGDANSESDIDHVTIQVSLEKNRGFFDALHQCSHWVVTVDAFVGREQVEALENGPEVVRVKTGVGANGAYRLVVSSVAGRKFVEARLERRIRQQVLESALSDPKALAASVYDRARLMVPGIVLRSLGLGRTAAEMVGLVIARARVEQAVPARVGPDGFQSWLSLDEHPDWSGGHRKARADLARLRGWLQGGALHLEVDVVEAKMRTQFQVKRADGQLARSIELLSSALRQGDGGDVPFVDVGLWRRLIWRAIDQTAAAPDTTPAATHVVRNGERRSGLDDRLAGALRQGNIVIHGVQGILVSLTDADDGSDGETPAGHRWLRMSLQEARHELGRLSISNDFPLLDREPARGAEVSTVLDDAADSDASPTSSKAEGGGRAMTAPSDPISSGAEFMRGGASSAAKQRLQDLLDALAKRGVQAARAQGPDTALEGPGFYVLRIELRGDATPQTVASKATDLQYLLKLQAGQEPRIYVDLGTIVVELPKREEERYYVSAASLWERAEWPIGALYAPIGVDVRNEVVGVNFSSSRSPHLLIGGMTGGGKSVALESLLQGLVEHYADDQLELRIIDPKGNEFTLFEGLPHVPCAPGMDAEDAIEMLERTCEEMDERYRAMKDLSRNRKERVKDIASYNALVDSSERFKWIVVVLDEFADLTADKDDKKAIEGLLQRIAQKARACGIHAIVATQKPSAQVISTTTRSNLGAQLALRVKSGTDSRVIMETVGAESLAGNGDAFLRLSGEEPIRIQCAKT
jgi:DNA segregation ATPase FtsK/SpoIIIE, S-DNA-T family